MNKQWYNQNKDFLASIKYVKDVKDVKNDKEHNDVKDDKSIKEEKEVKCIKQFSPDLSRLKALAVKRETDDLTTSSLESLREEKQSSGQGQELLDSGQWVEGLCEGPGASHWARMRCQYFLQTSNRGDEYKIKLLLTAEDGVRLELMSNVGRAYDFPRGLETLVQDDAWYKGINNELRARGLKCGKFYVANTKTNRKERRNTTPEPYTAVTVDCIDDGYYQVQIWLWNARWNLILGDRFLTQAQKTKGNMLAKTEWFNPNSTQNHNTPSALSLLNWKNT